MIFISQINVAAGLKPTWFHGHLVLRNGWVLMKGSLTEREWLKWATLNQAKLFWPQKTNSFWIYIDLLKSCPKYTLVFLVASPGLLPVLVFNILWKTMEYFRLGQHFLIFRFTNRGPLWVSEEGKKIKIKWTIL